ncbi:ribose-5-phosphate isomerase RpiA [bacterium]|nr:ribose-5-phosphate isomerase RpiA [bacterium]MBP9811165.1 ribose-5-phosphate isomerase RpiA [bacterium]
MPTTTVEGEKRVAAEKAVEFVENEMILGLGTGSTVAFVLQALARKVKEGLRVKGIPTSEATAKLARELGIELTDFDHHQVCDLVIDGADEVNGNLDLIKGGGGALLREKIVASSGRKFIVIVDSQKLVERLGKFHVPVEVIQFASPLVQAKVADLGGSGKLRMLPSGQPFVTDEGNYILDCNFGLFDKPAELAERLEKIPGIVEHGLFINYATKVIVGRGDATEIIG